MNYLQILDCHEFLIFANPLCLLFLPKHRGDIDECKYIVAVEDKQKLRIK